MSIITINPNGILRKLMPQIKRKDRPSLTSVLALSAPEPVGCDRKIVPTQRSLIQSKVDFLMANPEEIGPVIVSCDGKILDGHHNWYAACQLRQYNSLMIQTSAFNFDALYIEAHKAVSKVGIKKSIENITAMCDGVESTYNELFEMFSEYVQDIHPETAAPMAQLLDEKSKKLQERIAVLNLRALITREKISDAKAAANGQLHLVKDKVGKAQEKKKSNLRKEIGKLEKKLLFFDGLDLAINIINQRQEEVIRRLMDGFVAGVLDVSHDALAGSIFQLKDVDVDIAVQELERFSSEPRLLLDRIINQIDNLNGFNPGKVDCDMDALAEAWDLSYPTAYHVAFRKSTEAREEAKRLAQQVLMSNISSAGKCWLSKAILELVGDNGFKIKESFEADSVVKGNGGDSMSMPLKEAEGNPMSYAGKKFLASACAESLDMPILLSAGGGMQFLNPVFAKVFRYVTEKLVDIKAYIASANSSAVRKTIETDCYLGTQVHELFADGAPVVHQKTGMQIAIESAAEGSHWLPRSWMYAHKLQNQSNHVGCQIRGLSHDFIEKVLKPAAASHEKVTEDFSDWLGSSKGNFFLLGQQVFRNALLKGHVKVLHDNNSLINSEYAKQRGIIILSTQEELESRSPGTASYNPDSNYGRKQTSLPATEMDAWKNDQVVLANGETIVLPMDFWKHAGELSQEEFKALPAKEKIPYLNKLTADTIAKLIPADLSGKVNARWMAIKTEEGSNLAFVLESSQRNIKNVAYFLSSVVKRHMEVEKLLKTYSYWDTFQAESYEDFMKKVETGFEFEGKFNDAINELKAMIPSLIKQANTKYYMNLRIIAQRKGQPLYNWSVKWFSTSSYGERGANICEAKRNSDNQIVVPEYHRTHLWGEECENFSLFIKGIGVDHVCQDVDGHYSGFVHPDGTIAEEIPVISGLDGVKCEHKKAVEKRTRKFLNERYHIVAWDDPVYGVAAQGFENFKTKSITISKEKERISLGIMRIFKTSKVVVTSQFLEKLPTDLYGSNLGSDSIKATEESSKAFIDYLSPSWGWMQKVFSMLRSIPTGPIQTSDYYEQMDEVDDVLSPSKLFRNLMCVNSRNIQGPTFWKDIEDSIASGKNAANVEVMKRANAAVGAPEDEVMKNSMAYQTAVTEMVNSRLQEACKGSIVKGKYFVVKNFELLPDRVIVVHKKYRTKKGGVDGAAWRFPIATATSLMNMEVVFSDDKRYLKTLMEAGICDHNGEMADVVLMNSKCKLWFQQDDDGDQFGVIIDPKDPTREDFAILQWHINNANESYGSEEWKEMMRAAKKLYKKLEAKIVIALTKLRREDYPSVDIEMETIPGGKALFKFLDDNGVCTKHFKTLAAEDLRGPVGLVSDLMTVILASGEHGDDLARVARCLGYLLQHCIDSAKKNKLMIPAAVLMHIAFWILNGDRYEMVDTGNEAIALWNEAWRQLDLDAIKDLEDKYEFIPKHEDVLSSLYYDHKYLYFAPCTLLTHLQKKAKQGTYGEIELFGKMYPVPASAFDCIDETRYVSAHVFNVVDVKDRSGKRRSWSQMARFRSIRIEDYLATVRRKVELVVNGVKKEQWKLFWPEACDGDGYAAYWTRDPDAKINPGFAGVVTQSIPNYIFKQQLRFSMEMIFGGKDALVEESKKWQAPEGRNTSFQTKLQHSYQNGNAFFANALQSKGNRVKNFLIKNKENWYDVKAQKTGTLDSKASTFCMQILGVHTKKDAPIILPATFLAAMDVDKNYSHLAGPDGLDFKAVYEKLYSSTEAKDVKLANTILNDLREVLWVYVVHQLNQPAYRNGQYNPNVIQGMFAASINKVFKADITKKGMAPERSYTIPNSRKSADDPASWAFQRKPAYNWFKGDWTVWKSFAMGAANDIVVKALARLPLWNACGFTCTIDLERDGCVTETKFGDHVVKNIDQVKLNQVVTNYSVAHLKLAVDGEEPVAITDCACCMKEIRSQVAKVERSGAAIPGTKAYQDRKVALAAVKTSITCLESVKFQARNLVDQIMETKSPMLFIDSICKESNFGLEPETVRLFVSTYGTNEEKLAFGFSTIEAEVLYGEWQSLINAFDEEDIKERMDLIEAVNSGRNWFTFPLAYLIEVVRGELITFDEWQNNGDSDPRPPSGGGGGTNINNEENMKTKIMVTGHRPQKLGGFKPNATQTFVKEQLERVIKKLDNGSCELVTGMALGVDQWFCEIGLGLGLKVHAYLPCKGQSKPWREEAQKKHRELTLQCDWRLISKDTYQGPHQLLNRNTAMVNDSDIAIIVWDGKENGGTWDAVQKIRKANNIKKAIHINPATRKVTLMFER